MLEVGGSRIAALEARAVEDKGGKKGRNISPLSRGGCGALFKINRIIFGSITTFSENRTSWKDTRTYLKIKSYRRKSVSSDFSVLNWQFVILHFYIIKKQSHWIPGQARNDKKTQKTYFEIGSI